MFGAILQGQNAVLCALHGGALMQCNALPLDCVPDRGEKAGAVNGEAEPRAAVVVVPHVQNRATCFGLKPKHVIDRVAQFQRLIQGIDLGQDRLPDGLDHKARADGSGAVELVKHRDIMAVLSQQCGEPSTRQSLRLQLRFS